VDSFRGADINTGLAVDTHVLVNFCFFFIDRDCRSRAFIYAGFTTGTSFFINNSYQNCSLHHNGFGRADINTGLTVDTHVLVNFCLFFIDRDCRCRTFIHAGFTTGTFFFVYDCHQNGHSTVYVSQNTKKGFRYVHDGHVFLRLRTSFMPYMPGFLPTTQRVARSAPLAKTARS